MVGGGSPAGPPVSCPRGDGTWIPGSRKSPFHIFFCCVVIPSYHQPIAMTHLRKRRLAAVLRCSWYRSCFVSYLVQTDRKAFRVCHDSLSRLLCV